MAGNSELNKLVLEDVRDFDTAQIFESGQCFRFVCEHDGSYTGVVRGCFANISYNNEEDTLTIWSNYLNEGSDALRLRFWREYLDLDRDYKEIKRTLSDKDSVMEKAILAAGGLRVLNQEPWETLVSFIISQNSNIPRIRGCIEDMCERFGEKIGRFGDRELYSFPAIAELADATVDELDLCKLGYRAQYIAETARRINIDGGVFLDTADKATSERAEEYLLSLPGVGPKVAHCVMLFSMKKADIFPVDVWVARAMHQLYGIPEDDHDAMREYAQNHFAPWSGIAQMYLFEYIRRSEKTV
ncbi:MAG: 8-oxoguanine DNA glycosylase [Clostridiales bacterium]|nr:8-oxoguanine DNA glycosylase [Clostridiales bacterium]